MDFTSFNSHDCELIISIGDAANHAHFMLQKYKNQRVFNAPGRWCKLRPGSQSMFSDAAFPESTPPGKDCQATPRLSSSYFLLQATTNLLQKEML